MMFGFACFTLSMWAFAPITHDWAGRELLLPQALRGFGSAVRGSANRNVSLGSPWHPNDSNCFRAVQSDAQSRRCDWHRRLRHWILNDRSNVHFLHLGEHLNGSNSGAQTLLSQANRRRRLALERRHR